MKQKKETHAELSDYINLDIPMISLATIAVGLFLLFQNKHRMKFRV